MLTSIEPLNTPMLYLSANDQTRLGEINRHWNNDIVANRAAVIEIYTPLVRRTKKDGITVSRDIEYGADPRQRLDIFVPDGGKTSRVLVFVHGVAFSSDNKSANGDFNATQVLVVSVNQPSTHARYTARSSYQPDGVAEWIRLSCRRSIMLRRKQSSPKTVACSHYYARDFTQKCIGLVFRLTKSAQPRTVSLTARTDLADAVQLTHESRLGGIMSPLPACQALATAELAVIASELTGRDMKRVTPAGDAWVEEKVSDGLQRYMVETLLATFRAARRSPPARNPRAPLLG